MSPYRDYPEPVRSARRCFPSLRCAVCATQPAQLLKEFYALVHGSWSMAEREFLSKAARSALLLLLNGKCRSR